MIHLSCGTEGGESVGYLLPLPTIPARPETLKTRITNYKYNHINYYISIHTSGQLC